MQLSNCVVVDDYGRILLLHRTPTDEGLGQWELPGGEIEQGESAANASVRSIDEELGVTVELTKPLDVGMLEAGEDTYEYALFQAVVTEADPQLRGTETFDDLDYFEVEDLSSLALSPISLLVLEKIISGEVALEV